MYPIIKLGSISLPVFNFLVGLSIYVGFKIFVKEENRDNSDSFIKQNKELIFCINILLGFFFAALFENIYHTDFQKIGQYGITFYGGLLIAIPLNFILLKFSLSRFLLIFNISIPALLISHAIGRLGCFMAGCCYGKVSKGIFGIFFPNGEQRIPTQLIEAIMLIVIFTIILKMVKFEDRYFYYFLLYGIIRIFIELFRDDDRGSLFHSTISPAQLISILLICFAFSIKIVKLFTDSTTHQPLPN